MVTKAKPVPLEPELPRSLREGARRTLHKKQELIRITQRGGQPRMIEREAGKRSRTRLTRIEPWSASNLRRAYQVMGQEWDALEEAATKAQSRPE